VLILDLSTTGEHVVEEGAETFVAARLEHQRKHFIELVKVRSYDIKLVTAVEASHLRGSDIAAVFAVRIGYFRPDLGFNLRIRQR
jgi:hypothetical protein